MPLPPEFQVTETDGALRIEWDNRRVLRDGWGWLWLGLAWVALAVVASALTLGFYHSVKMRPAEPLGGHDFGEICCLIPFAWSFVLFLPYWFSSRLWREIVEVSRDAITHTRIGWRAPKPTVYPLAEVSKLALKWDESAAGVFVVVGSGMWSADYRLVQWLHTPHQQQLFETIREFATRTGLPLAFDE
jgi:hypothetical protein